MSRYSVFSLEGGGGNSMEVNNIMIKKAILIVFLIVLTGALIITSGCSEDIDGEAKNEMINAETSNQDIMTPSSLGGISLGDSLQTVVDVLGNNYTESTESDNAEYIGEDMTVWSYESGIVVSFGKTSGKVLRITSTSTDLKTNLGIKVGDAAKTVFETYKPLYEEAVSRHSDEMLTGWFLMEDGAVMIFDFDKSDGAVVNSNVTPDSSVEKIILAYWKHFD